MQQLCHTVFVWILGHIGHPKHKTVDHVAPKAIHISKITDPLPSPAYDLKKFHLSSIIAPWHNLWKNEPHNNFGTIKIKPIPSEIEISTKRESFFPSQDWHTPFTTSHHLQGLHVCPSYNYFHVHKFTVQHLVSCPILQNQLTFQPLLHTLLFVTTLKKYPIPLTTYVRLIFFVNLFLSR